MGNVEDDEGHENESEREREQERSLKENLCLHTRAGEVLLSAVVICDTRRHLRASCLQEFGKQLTEWEANVTLAEHRGVQHVGTQAKIPDRRVLSGRVLDRLVIQVETEMKSKVSGKLETGQCDGEFKLTPGTQP
ncbi:hypothetical protein B0H14DRAFT_2645715 [Mycena olivaceomarginata]|nr:hypothetical protein B0H14DRAFT_2645715 [Mycena olivaceomarginata]